MTPCVSKQKRKCCQNKPNNLGELKHSIVIIYEAQTTRGLTEHEVVYTKHAETKAVDGLQ